MAYWRRVVTFGVVGTVVVYYSPWVHAKLFEWETEPWLGRSWEMIKQREDQFRTTRWLTRPVRQPWWNSSRSRLNYYLFGPDTLRAVGSDLPHGKEAIEEFIEYQRDARVRPLGPWFDAFSDPRALAVLDEYTKTSPAITADKLDRVPDHHYKTSYGGATLPEGKPRGVSMGAFLYDQPGFDDFYDTARQQELDTWSNIEMHMEDPKDRAMLKQSIQAFKMYWAEQLEEYLPYIACRPKQKKKLSDFLMSLDAEGQELCGQLMIQKDGFKKVLQAAGVDMSLDSI